MLGPLVRPSSRTDGLQPDEPGCWRVTASYRDAELSYVYLLDEPAADPTGSPQELTQSCTQDQLADRRAAEEELADLIEAAGYEPGPLDSHVAMLDEGCEEIEVLGLQTSFTVDTETVRVVWDGPARLSSDRPEPTAPPLRVGDVTVQQSDNDTLGTWMWFACGEAQVSFFHDVFESNDLADDPRARMNVDPWDSDPELLAQVARDIAEVVDCPAGLLDGDG